MKSALACVSDYVHEEGVSAAARLKHRTIVRKTQSLSIFQLSVCIFNAAFTVMNVFDERRGAGKKMYLFYYLRYALGILCRYHIQWPWIVFIPPANMYILCVYSLTSRHTRGNSIIVKTSSTTPTFCWHMHINRTNTSLKTNAFYW